MNAAAAYHVRWLNGFTWHHKSRVLSHLPHKLVIFFVKAMCVVLHAYLLDTPWSSLQCWFPQIIVACVSYSGLFHVFGLQCVCFWCMFLMFCQPRSVLWTAHATLFSNCFFSMEELSMRLDPMPIQWQQMLIMWCTCQMLSLLWLPHPFVTELPNFLVTNKNSPALLHLDVWDLK